MEKIYFTSDLHFHHTNIIKYCNRPFGSVEEMDQALIRNWVEVVQPCDTVYVLGDFAFTKSQPEITRLLSCLPGHKHLIAGNHDKNTTRFAKGWASVSDLRKVVVNDQRIILCHYSMRIWDQSHRGSWCLYGHSHGKLPPYGKSFDIGVDAWNYTPVSFDQVAEKMLSLELDNVQKHHDMESE